jgi:hypothetical protein
VVVEEEEEDDDEEPSLLPLEVIVLSVKEEDPRLELPDDCDGDDERVKRKEEEEDPEGIASLANIDRSLSGRSLERVMVSISPLEIKYGKAMLFDCAMLTQYTSNSFAIFQIVSFS